MLNFMTRDSYMYFQRSGPASKQGLLSQLPTNERDTGGPVPVSSSANEEGSLCPSFCLPPKLCQWEYESPSAVCLAHESPTGSEACQPSSSCQAATYSPQQQQIKQEFLGALFLLGEGVQRRLEKEGVKMTGDSFG